jgi:ABC-type uncharacterized transport system ATPase subunit
MAAARPQVLEMRHITKRFPGIVANDDVGLGLREGEVHALLGENGAGKSTLMNILYGLYHPDEGEILIKGSPVRLGSPSAAIDAGVGMVHQHFMLIPVMTVAENIVLAEEPTRERVFLDMAEAERRVQEISDRYGLARYVARKGSIAVNGVSLTVNAVNGGTFEINLIPHTLQATNLNGLAVGARVNLEVDLLARYAERLSEASK